MKNERIEPLEAWCRSVPCVILWPLVLYILGGLPILSNGFGVLSVVGLAAGIGLTIHLMAYLVVGVPVYLLFWKSCPTLWTLKMGLLVGVILGGFTLVGLFLFLYGVIHESEMMMLFFVGGVYGVITAAAAIYSCRNHLK